MIEPMLVAGLLELVKDVGAGLLSPGAFARRLLDLVEATGIAPALLAEYLTADGIRRAELAADIAEEAKLAVKRMGG
jgi:hypothetical protein